MILSRNLLIAAVARAIPQTAFASRPERAGLAALLILAGVALVLWVNLRHAG